MPTDKQKAVAKDILENPGKPLSRAMIDAGYSEASAHNPQNFRKTKGFLATMSGLGLTQELVGKTLVSEIEAARPGTGRVVPALSLAAKILGMEPTGGEGKENPILVLLQAYGVVNNDGKLNYEENVIDQPDQADEERPSAEDSQG